MKYLAALGLCLLLAGGCTRTTYLPGHNLDGKSAGETCTLELTSLMPAERTAAIEAFMEKLVGRTGKMTVSYGSRILDEELASVERQLAGHGVSSANLNLEKNTSGYGLMIVFAEKKNYFPALDTYWFSSAAVSPEFGKSTNYNFAAQMVHPEELSKPGELGPANPQGAVGPVERYQSGQVRELPDVDLSVGGGSSGSSSGSGS